MCPIDLCKGTVVTLSIVEADKIVYYTQCNVCGNVFDKWIVYK